MNRQYATLIDHIEASGKELLSYLSRLPADEITRVPAPGEWSAHAIAAHLRDTQRYVLAQRTQRILRQAEPPFVENFDQEQWNREHYSPAEPFKKILGEFRTARRQFLKLLRGSTDKDWP